MMTASGLSRRFPAEKERPLDAAQPIRRSRGYAPFPLKLPFSSRPILACGPELKNTFCFTRDRYAFLSQHIGDMENLETLDHFETSIRVYERLFRLKPEALVHDLHPDYLSTRYAEERASRDSLPLLGVQHHHAHAVSCMVDNGLTEPVIAVTLDGTGFGLDGHIWGGEWLIADGRGFRRVAWLEPLPLPGGDAGIRNPGRIAIAYLHRLFGAVPPIPFTLRDWMKRKEKRSPFRSTEGSTSHGLLPAGDCSTRWPPWRADVSASPMRPRQPLKWRWSVGTLQNHTPMTFDPWSNRFIGERREGCQRSDHPRKSLSNRCWHPLSRTFNGTNRSLRLEADFTGA